MFEFKITYDEFKLIALKKKSFWQHIEHADTYEVFAIDGPIKYSATVYKVFEGKGVDPVAEAANLEDYETNYLPDSNRPIDISPTAAMTQFHGKTIEMEAGATFGYCEWSFDTDVFISKVMPMPIDALKGDTLSFEVWAKEGALGEGVPATKVGQYGFDIPIRGTGGMGWIYGSGGGEIKSFCTIRCYYNKLAGVARDFNIIAEFLV
jgi:hypothetical protein